MTIYRAGDVLGGNDDRTPPQGIGVVVPDPGEQTTKIKVPATRPLRKRLKLKRKPLLIAFALVVSLAVLAGIFVVFTLAIGKSVQGLSNGVSGKDSATGATTPKPDESSSLGDNPNPTPSASPTPRATSREDGDNRPAAGSKPKPTTITLRFNLQRVCRSQHGSNAKYYAGGGICIDPKNAEAQSLDLDSYCGGRGKALRRVPFGTYNWFCADNPDGPIDLRIICRTMGKAYGVSGATWVDRINPNDPTDSWRCYIPQPLGKPKFSNFCRAHNATYQSVTHGNLVCVRRN